MQQTLKDQLYSTHAHKTRQSEIKHHSKTMSEKPDLT